MKSNNNSTYLAKRKLKENINTDLLGEEQNQNLVQEKSYANQLYERIIRKQEDEISFLKGLINMLQR